MKKIRKDDEVIVVAGKDKGKIGKILRMLDNDKVLVDGINMVTKHVKPNPAKNEQGGFVKKNMPIHISNIALLNPSTKKADRVGFKIQEDGTKVRIYKSTGEIVSAA